MAPVKKKETQNTAETSSEPVSTKNRTPKSLKPKPKISRKSVDQGTLLVQKAKKARVLMVASEPVSSENITPKSLNHTPKAVGKFLNKGPLQIQEKQIKKKKIVSGSKKVHSNNEKEDANNQKARETKQNSTTDGKHIGKNQEIIKIKVNGSGSQNKQHNDLGQMNKEKPSGLQKKEHYGKKKEKASWFKKIEHSQMNEEKDGQLESQQNGKKKEKLGGLIFMCNAKTKPDCFRYSVMGITMSKKELVLGIKSGLKLFLYDFDLKLLYGIYKASSSGGMKLEPAAFGGAFPVQVRFNVHQDCYPLPESVFRKAIKENYNEKNKFNTELTVQQVKRLMELFRPAEVLTPAPPIGPTPMMAIHDMKVDEGARESLANQLTDSLAGDPRTYDEGRSYHVLANEKGQHLTSGQVPSTEREYFSQNYFPNEMEYRTYGLRRESQNLTPLISQIAPALEPHPGYMHKEAVPAQELATLHDPNLVNENWYQTYGYFPRQELQSSTPLVTTTMASNVDSYSKVRYPTYHYGGSFPDLYRPLSGSEQVPVGSYAFSGRGETYPSETAYLQRGETDLTETNHLGRREIGDAGMLYSTYASNALSEYNQTLMRQGAVPESSFAPVSSRYSFAGPPLSRR
ncbi:DCD (Development and Cell Death) domain protein [Actinidia rufa]|uniref:DCD (Development and Cell Death) domain protein n=1 Tax=Actinidia rufa TaxID=165716 RepID=A0A7J0EZX9_9ERIC|nr:DCD (Development and Cell Death) domain protein [Actinidia rufa]